MKPKILFINPPWYRLQNLISTYPPMGCLYIAALLEERGYECVVWHADYSNKAGGVSEGSSTINMNLMSRKYKEYLSVLNDLGHPIWLEVEKVIREQSPDVLGVVVHTASVGSVKNIVKIAKTVNEKIVVICGGPHATVRPQDLIEDPAIDFVVTGEGEHTTLAILENLNDVGKLSNIRGICFKKNGRTIHTGTKEEFEDVKDLPMPAKHLLLNKETMPSVVFQPIFTARGCPHKCIYCTTHKIHGYKTRTRDPKLIIAEIQCLRKEFNVHHFFICDDTFGQNKNHTMKLLDLIIRSKLDITWGCQTRGEKLTEEMTALMKKAGCTQVSIGVETGSPRIRNLIQKGNSVDDILNASRLLKKYKIELAAFFMFGFPGETIEDIKMSIDLLHKIQPYTAHCNIATPDPGTVLFEMAQKRGRLCTKIDWRTFFHQNPDLFSIDGLTKNQSRKLIGDLQDLFDSFNKKKQRMDLIRRFPLYFKIICRESLYKNPHYLLNKAKDLI